MINGDGESAEKEDEKHENTEGVRLRSPAAGLVSRRFRSGDQKRVNWSPTKNWNSQPLFPRR